MVVVIDAAVSSFTLVGGAIRSYHLIHPLLLLLVYLHPRLRLRPPSRLGTPLQPLLPSHIASRRLMKVMKMRARGAHIGSCCARWPWSGWRRNAGRVFLWNAGRVFHHNSHHCRERMVLLVLLLLYLLLLLLRLHVSSTSHLRLFILPTGLRSIMPALARTLRIVLVCPHVHHYPVLVFLFLLHPIHLLSHVFHYRLQLL